MHADMRVCLCAVSQPLLPLAAAAIARPALLLITTKTWFGVPHTLLSDMQQSLLRRPHGFYWQYWHSMCCGASLLCSPHPSATTSTSTCSPCPSPLPPMLVLVQLCPKGDWRSLMEPTRQAARQLARQGVIEITQKGKVGGLGTHWGSHGSGVMAGSCWFHVNVTRHG